MVKGMASFNSQMNRLKSQLRKVERQAKQEMNKYNANVRKFNTAVRKYNSETRKLNSQINRDFNKLRNIKYSSPYYNTSNSLHTMYSKITDLYDICQFDEDIYSDIEKENANNLELANVILDKDEVDNSQVDLAESSVSDLLNFDSDLKNRWEGAIYSLSPKNPDAARHFCTSTREILISLLDNGISNKDVELDDPNCEKTDRGTPTRNAKVKYAIKKKGYESELLLDFIIADIDNIVSLISELSSGTHGSSTKFTLEQLKSFKKRFEDGICFIFKYVL